MLRKGYALAAFAVAVMMPATPGEAQRVQESSAASAAYRAVVQGALVQKRALAPNAASAESQWFPQDDADSLYRAGRGELRARNYARAVRLFRSLRSRYANSSYVSQSMYWEAFALNRIGDEDSLRRGLQVLQEQKERFPDQISSDAKYLSVRIRGSLARQGDLAAVQALAIQAEAAQVAVNADRVAALAGAGQAQVARQRRQSQGDDDDLKLQALSALMQMDAEVAMPILRRVLENRSEENTGMRRRAIFLVAQKRGVDRENILIDVVRNDPDSEVRSSAVFHLSQVRTPEAVAALDSILQSSNDRELQERALFALSQHRSERAGEILRNYAQRRDASIGLRAVAIQWLGQRRDNASFLRDLYQQLSEPDLKEKVLFALSQTRAEENAGFLLSIATDESESIEVRKRALFWLGQMRVESVELYALYARMTDMEMKEQLIFVYSQRRNEDAAIEKLIEIVRTESDARLQSRAIFWLGQTRDPRAIALLEEIINR